VKGEPRESIIWCRTGTLPPEHQRVLSAHINVVEGVS